MNKDGNDGAVDTDDPGQPAVSSLPADRLAAVLAKESPRWEHAVMADEATLRHREQLVAAREDAAQLREANATLREHEIRAAQALRAASDDHMLMLQQANARLVIATIEAQKLTEQVETSKALLESAKCVAEQANLAKSEFLSSMSHELRTPLNAILGFAQLMELGSPPPTPSQKGSIDQILRAGWYLLELINQILDLAVIESGRLPVVREPVLLIEVMGECQAMIETQAQQRGIRVDFLPFDNTWTANADRTRVKQVLINLLSNAIKYNCKHGTVEVKCTAGTPGRLRISVKDSGAGLPAEKLAQLFQPFNRLGHENGTEQGTGIGLVVAKQLVELMGGTIGVESTVGVGSEFWIELVQDLAPQRTAGNTVPAERAPPAPANAAPRTLLYVEDNPANLVLVKQIIAGRPDLRMLSVSDGHLGIALAHAHPPDVILLDINLPGISGFEVLKILRGDPATKHIPVLAISANALPSDIEKGIDAGFVCYLTEPIKFNALMDALDMALELAPTGSRQST